MYCTYSMYCGMFHVFDVFYRIVCPSLEYERGIASAVHDWLRLKSPWPSSTSCIWRRFWLCIDGLIADTQKCSLSVTDHSTGSLTLLLPAYSLMAKLSYSIRLYYAVWCSKKARPAAPARELGKGGQKHHLSTWSPTMCPSTRAPRNPPQSTVHGPLHVSTASCIGYMQQTSSRFEPWLMAAQ